MINLEKNFTVMFTEYIELIFDVVQENREKNIQIKVS
jgi:hypothetical protein